MALGKNSTEAMMRVHDQARKKYIAGEKGNHFQHMLNAEMFFWRAYDCGTRPAMLHYHDRLVGYRKNAMRIKQES